MRCIICCEDKLQSDMSIEHVFPESIGGKYTIRSVCKSCNSHLGSKVDTHLVDLWFVAAERSFIGLPGKTGKTPTLFKVGRMADDSGREVRIKADHQTGILRPHTVQKVSKITDEDGKVSYNISIDAADKSKLPGIVNKILTRRGLPGKTNEEIDSASEYRQVDQPEINFQIKIDLLQYQRALWKIAYEMACTWLGESYMDDEQAIIIRKAMLDESLEVDFYNKHKISGTVQFVAGSQKIFPWWFDGSKSHLCVMKINGDAVIIYIRIFEIIECVVVVSNTQKNYADAKEMFLSINPQHGVVRECLLSAEFTRLSKTMFRPFGGLA
jgi:hypothetical protein